MRTLVVAGVFAVLAAGCVKSSESSPLADSPPIAPAHGAPISQVPASAPLPPRRFWPLQRQVPPTREEGTDWRDAGSVRRRAYTSAYSRTLRTVLFERTYRWQSRHLVDGLRRDLGLRFRGWYQDAQEGWVQPTSLFTDPHGGKIVPIRMPLLLEGATQTWAVDTEQVDVLMIGDMGINTMRTLDWGVAARFVMDGGGLVLLPGLELLELARVPEFRVLCPVVPNYRYVDHPVADPDRMLYVAPTESGEAHDLLNLTDSEAADRALLGRQEAGVYRRGELDGLYWVAPVASVRPRATVLAYGVEDGKPLKSGTPLLVVQQIGLGRVVWVGTDDLWQWRQYVGDLYFYQFFQNVIRWAANDPGPG